MNEANASLYLAAVNAAQALASDKTVSEHETLNQLTCLENEVAAMIDMVVNDLERDNE